MVARENANKNSNTGSSLLVFTPSITSVVDLKPEFSFLRQMWILEGLQFQKGPVSSTL